MRGWSQYACGERSEISYRQRLYGGAIRRALSRPNKRGCGRCVHFGVSCFDDRPRLSDWLDVGLVRQDACSGKHTRCLNHGRQPVALGGSRGMAAPDREARMKIYVYYKVDRGYYDRPIKAGGHRGRFQFASVAHPAHSLQLGSANLRAGLPGSGGRAQQLPVAPASRAHLPLSLSTGRARRSGGSA